MNHNHVNKNQDGSLVDLLLLLVIKMTRCSSGGDGVLNLQAKTTIVTSVVCPQPRLCKLRRHLDIFIYTIMSIAAALLPTTKYCPCISLVRFYLAKRQFDVTKNVSFFRDFRIRTQELERRRNLFTNVLRIIAMEVQSRTKCQNRSIWHGF